MQRSLSQSGSPVCTYRVPWTDFGQKFFHLRILEHGLGVLLPDDPGGVLHCSIAGLQPAVGGAEREREREGEGYLEGGSDSRVSGGAHHSVWEAVSVLSKTAYDCGNKADMLPCSTYILVRPYQIDFGFQGQARAKLRLG